MGGVKGRRKQQRNSSKSKNSSSASNYNIIGTNIASGKLWNEKETKAAQ
jgi:hypothetical protein